MATPISQQELRGTSSRVTGRTAQVQQAEVQRQAVVEYESGVAKQSTQLTAELAERQQKIQDWVVYKKTRSWHFASKKRRATINKEIAKVKGEIEYLIEAQKVVATGSQVNVNDFNSASRAYALTTEKYQKMKYKLKDIRYDQQAASAQKKAQAEYERQVKLIEGIGKGISKDDVAGQAAVLAAQKRAYDKAGIKYEVTTTPAVEQSPKYLTTRVVPTEINTSGRTVVGSITDKIKSNIGDLNPITAAVGA